MRKYILFILMLTVCAKAQVNSAGSLTAYVDSLILKIPDVTPSNLYQAPDSGQKTVWTSAVDHLLAGNYSPAHTAALTIGYEVVRFSDTSNVKTYYVLRKKADGQNYWGTFIIDPVPRRSRLFIQIPHPLYDTKSGNQGIVVFRNTGARAFIIAGTHRCNSTLLSTCDGTTTVCSGTASAFSASDQAHTAVGSFQLTTQSFKKNTPDAVVVQLHGFGKGAGDPDVIMGNGTNKAPSGTDLLLLFKSALSAIDPTLTFKIAHIDTAWTELTGTTNTQGRLINGSPDPCGTKASSATGRFMHIEQAFTKLRDNAVGWTKVADALAATVPADPVAVESHADAAILRFQLFENYPNPFNPATTISYQVPVTGMTTLKVYDAIGREAATLVNEMKEAGSYSVQFDGSSFSSGLYLARLTSNGNTSLRKMLLLK